MVTLVTGLLKLAPRTFPVPVFASNPPGEVPLGTGVVSTGIPMYERAAFVLGWELELLAELPHCQLTALPPVAPKGSLLVYAKRS